MVVSLELSDAGLSPKSPHEDEEGESLRSFHVGLQGSWRVTLSDVIVVRPRDSVGTLGSCVLCVYTVHIIYTVL